MDGAAKATVDLAAATLAELIRRYCGDLVIGLHLVGSIADGDFGRARAISISSPSCRACRPMPI